MIDELYERIKNNKYQFRTVGIKLMKTDFSIETREKFYNNYQSERKSIESVIEEPLNKFILVNRTYATTTTSTTANLKPTNTKKILHKRKVGLRISNLITIEKVIIKTANLNKKNIRLLLATKINSCSYKKLKFVNSIKILNQF